MKIKFKLWLFVITFFIGCNFEKENLDYPKSFEEVEKVILLRQSEESNGKFTEEQHLNESEIKALLHSLDKAKSIGLTKFYPDYFIFFKTKGGYNKKLKVNHITVKGYKNDFSYEFSPPEFLSTF